MTYSEIQAIGREMTQFAAAVDDVWRARDEGTSQELVVACDHLLSIVRQLAVAVFKNSLPPIPRGELN